MNLVEPSYRLRSYCLKKFKLTSPSAVWIFNQKVTSFHLREPSNSLKSNLANLRLQASSLIIHFALLIWPTVASLKAQEVAILPLAADTCLFELDPDFNFGSQRDLPAGSLGPMGDRLRSRLLFRVDVAGGLPQGAEIVSARLLTEVTMVPIGRANSTFALHRVLVPWEEGDKRDVDNPGGDEASDGETTWAQRLQAEADWSEPGGGFGTDYAAQPSGSRAISGAGAYNFPFNTLGLADLSNMLHEPETNHGWVLVTEEEDRAKTARRFAAKEHRTAPPMLEIQYTVELSETPAPPLTITYDGEAFVIRFPAIADQAYQVQTTTDLTAGSWQDDQIIQLPNSGIAEFRNKLNESAQFFRIIAITHLARPLG